jgi:uncharacterized protein (TIGR03435 family)
MTKTFTLSTLLLFTLAHGHCEDIAKAPAFEVVSITPCKPGTPEPPGEHAGMVQFTSPGGRFRASATTVKYLFEWAYRIQAFQHSDGPSWFGTDRYDIEAKAEGNASDDQMRLMAQTLLADRFKLKFRRESKVLSAYVISVGKSAPKLSPAKDGETHFLRVTPQMGADHKPVSFRVDATRFTLTQFGETFARVLGSPIVDQTGLTGDFDFTVDLTPDESRPSPMDPALLIGAMRDQLGLKVTSQKAPVDFLVIDNVEKVASGN